MKTFEERYTSWIDGKLQGAELAAFEKELEDPTAAEQDKKEALELGQLLRSHGVMPLTNPDFFNSQLMARIERDVARTERSASSGTWFSWPWLRFAVTGAVAVFVGWGIARMMNPVPQELPAKGAPAAAFTAQIINPKPMEPGISASVVEDSEDGVTVLWLDGLEYLPASYELQ